MGCQVLQQYVMASLPNRLLIWNAGGVCAIHFAMLHHQGNPSLQECACWTLELLCRRSKHRVALAPLGECLIGSTLLALSAYKVHLGIQQRGLGLLAKLAKNETYLKLVVDKGSIDLAITRTILAKHVRYRPIVPVALDLLHSAACQSSANSASWQAITLGIEVILSAMNKNTLSDSGIQGRGIAVLATVAMVEF